MSPACNVVPSCHKLLVRALLSFELSTLFLRCTMHNGYEVPPCMIKQASERSQPNNNSILPSMSMMPSPVLTLAAQAFFFSYPDRVWAPRPACLSSWSCWSCAQPQSSGGQARTLQSELHEEQLHSTPHCPVRERADEISTAGVHAGLRPALAGAIWVAPLRMHLQGDSLHSCLEVQVSTLTPGQPAS